MLVMLDCDSVLYSTNCSILKKLGVNPRKRLYRNALKQNFYYIEENFPDMDGQIRSWGDSFWRNLRLLPWAKALYNHCCRLVGKDNVYFLTSYGKFHEAPNAKADRVLEDFGSRRVILTHYKELLAAPNRILIDDKPKNINKFNDAGGIGYLFPCYYSIFDKEINIKDIYKDIKLLCKASSKYDFEIPI